MLQIFVLSLIQLVSFAVLSLIHACNSDSYSTGCFIVIIHSMHSPWHATELKYECVGMDIYFNANMSISNMPTIEIK